MSTIRRFVQRLLSAVRPHQAEDDLAREINSHLHLLEDRFVAQGMTRDEARFAARRAFGGVEQAKEHQRDTRSFRWLDDSRIDFKLGARMLAKYPWLSLIGAAGLAVGIAVSTSFFTFFYTHLYSALPVEEGHRIVALENWDLAKNNEDHRQAHDFVTWRDEMRSVEDVSAFRTVGRNLIAPGRAAEPVQVAEVTPSAFRVTRVPPILGRPLTDADAQAAAPPVVVIGDEVWHSRFGADPNIIGRDVRLGNVVHTVVGVMPEGYLFPSRHNYWTPLQLEPSRLAPLQGPGIFVFARLAPGHTIESAQAELTAIGARASAASPGTHAQIRPRVMPITRAMLDIQDVMLWQVGLFQFAMSLLLVVVAANVAVLIYARTATRQGELAVRTALGASRRRIVGQLFIEALVLSGAGAAAGLLLTRVGLAQANAIIESEFDGMPYWLDLSLPPIVLVYVLGLALLCAVMAGVVPALHATGRRVQSSLRELGGATGARLGATWTTLIVAQVGIAVAGLPMVVGAFGWTAITQGSTTTAFKSEPYLAAVVAMDPDPPPGGDSAAAAHDRAVRFTKFRTDLVAALEAEPQVDDVTMASAPPGEEPSARIEVADAAQPANGATLVQTSHVAIDYFDAFGARLLAGRVLTPADARAAARPVVVNRAFVSQVLGGGHAIGRRLRYAAPENANAGDVASETWHEVVGVVTDLRTNPIDPELVTPTVFHPLSEDASRTTFVVRARGADGASLAGRVRELAIAFDPAIRITTLTLADLQRQADAVTRLVMLAMVLIIVSVMLLSAAGIYALMSFTVTQRRKEIGIRAAMGASAAQLLRGIFARAAAQLSAGVVAGVIGAWALDTASGGEVLGPGGRLILPAISVLMIVVGMAAALAPARRGLRIQPTEALRDQ